MILKDKKSENCRRQAIYKIYLMLYNNQINARVLIGQSAMVHGKKGGVYLYAKRGVCLHLLVFINRKIHGFPIVLLSANSSIRSIIQ